MAAFGLPTLGWAWAFGIAALGAVVMWRIWNSDLSKKGAPLNTKTLGAGLGALVLVLGVLASGTFSTEGFNQQPFSALAPSLQPQVTGQPVFQPQQLQQPTTTPSRGK